MEQLDSKSSVCIKLVPRCFVNSAVQCSSVIWCNVTLSVQCTGYTSLFTWSSKNKIFGYYFQQVITWTTVLLHMYSMDPWFSYSWTGHNDVNHSCCVRHNGGEEEEVVTGGRRSDSWRGNIIDMWRQSNEGKDIARYEERVSHHLL